MFVLAGGERLLALEQPTVALDQVASVRRRSALADRPAPDPGRLQRHDAILLAGSSSPRQQREGGFGVALFLFGVLAQPYRSVLQTGVIGAGILKPNSRATWASSGA